MLWSCHDDFYLRWVATVQTMLAHNSQQALIGLQSSAWTFTCHCVVTSHSLQQPLKRIPPPLTTMTTNAYHPITTPTKHSTEYVHDSSTGGYTHYMIHQHTVPAYNTCDQYLNRQTNCQPVPTDYEQVQLLLCVRLLWTLTLPTLLSPCWWRSSPS